MLNANTIELIKEISSAKAPSGFEDEAIEVARKYSEGLGTFEEDHIRNLYIKRNGNSDKPMLMLDAHGDEVGFMVHSIRPNGTIRFVGLGGWNPGTLPSSRVWVRNADGEYIPGIIAAKPVHFMKQGEKGQTLELSDLSIDIGSTSREETEQSYRIRVGEPIVPDSEFTYDEVHGIIMGKAFDDRLGAAAMIETLRRLDGEDLKVDVIASMTSQEEVGERGAKVAVNRVKPEIAICFEGCPADDTIMEPYAVQAALGKGPMLRFFDRVMITNPRYMRYALDVAEKNGIPVQTAVREGGGTNGGAIHLAGEGIPCIVISIPVRYIHSHNGIAKLTDLDAAVELACAIIRSLDKETIDRF